MSKRINPYKTHWYHRRPAHVLRKHPGRADGVRARPEVVRLDPRAGVAPGGKPPVRIFLGTEPNQFRAERVFIWSIERVRDPARAYEIHLMKELAGFDRGRWKTGFTNYRYAIPSFAGGGRAIYNDVDQLYLSDPAELFDMEMNGGGIACISETETAVMLIDCEKMIEIWTPEEVRAPEHRHAYFLAKVHENGLWRPIPGPWNARDGEYPLTETKCLHYTTLHTQPWRPFPDQFRYRAGPLAEVFHDLEREADEAGFLPFDKDRPSDRFGELMRQYRTMQESRDPAGGGPALGDHGLERSADLIAGLIARTGATTILDCGPDKAPFYRRIPGEPDDSRRRAHIGWPGVTVFCQDHGCEPFAGSREKSCDGVVGADLVAHVPHEDVPWVLDEMFARAKLFVFVAAACYPARKFLPGGEDVHCTVESPDWWRAQMESCARRHPGVRWTLVCDSRGRWGKARKSFEGVGHSGDGGGFAPPGP